MASRTRVPAAQHLRPRGPGRSGCTLWTWATGPIPARRVTMRRGRATIVRLLALAAGLVIGLVDTSPTWDDTGITAVALLGASAVFGVLAPARAWRWALARGLWI